METKIIWTRNSEGQWSEAENLGEVINTDLDDDSPYLSADEHTLYFSSSTTVQLHPDFIKKDADSCT